MESKNRVAVPMKGQKYVVFEAKVVAQQINPLLCSAGIPYEHGLCPRCSTSNPVYTYGPEKTQRMVDGTNPCTHRGDLREAPGFRL